MLQLDIKSILINKNKTQYWEVTYELWIEQLTVGIKYIIARQPTYDLTHSKKFALR